MRPFLLFCSSNERQREQADHGRNPGVQEQEKGFGVGSYCGLDGGVNRRAQPHITGGEPQSEASLVCKVSNTEQVGYRVEPSDAVSCQHTEKKRLPCTNRNVYYR